MREEEEEEEDEAAPPNEKKGLHLSDTLQMANPYHILEKSLRGPSESNQNPYQIY